MFPKHKLIDVITSIKQHGALFPAPCYLSPGTSLPFFFDLVSCFLLFFFKFYGDEIDRCPPVNKSSFCEINNVFE